MVGKRQKHPEMLAFTRGGRGRQLQTLPMELQRTAPPCPEGAALETRLAWERLWDSPLSSTIAETDLPALYRWLWWLDQWVGATSSLSRIALRRPQGMKALLRYVRICEASLSKLEEAFGMTPLARMRLGITFTEGRSAMAKLQATLKHRTGEADPRDVLREGLQ